MPAAIKKITDSCTSKDHSHSILGEPNGIVLQSFVFSIQSDRDLKTDRSNVSDTANETYSLLLATLCTPKPEMVQDEVRNPSKEQRTLFGYDIKVDGELIPVLKSKTGHGTGLSITP